MRPLGGPVRDGRQGGFRAKSPRSQIRPDSAWEYAVVLGRCQRPERTLPEAAMAQEVLDRGCRIVGVWHPLDDIKTCLDTR